MDNNQLLSQLSQLMDNKLDTLRSEMAEVVQRENQKLRIEMQDMHSELNAKIDTQGESLNAKIDALRAEMKADNQKLFIDIVNVVETQATQIGIKYEHEVSGRINALNEETDILRDDVKDHEQRIHTVERKVGIAI